MKRRRPAMSRPRRVEIDAALRALGYCGRCDVSGRRRCYRRAKHRGRCEFFESFQLMRR